MDGTVPHHLSKDGSQTPHVHSSAVVLGTQQNLWRTIPQCDHLVCVWTHWYTKGASQAQVC